MRSAREEKSRSATLDPNKSRELRLASVIANQASILDEIVQGRALESFTAAELKQIGLTYNEKSDYQHAKKAFTLALSKLDEEIYSAQEAALITTYCYYGLANVRRELGNDDEAIKLFLEALKEAERIDPDSTEFLSISYDLERNLGIAYLNVKEYSEAATCFLRAIERAEQSGRSLLIPAVCSYYGLALTLSGAYKDGIAQLNLARALYPKEKREQSNDWAAHRYHMGRAYQAAGDAYQSNVEYVNAISEFHEALRLRMQITDPKIATVYYHSRVGDVHAGLGRCFFALKCYGEAGFFLKKALENYQVIANTKKIEETQKQLAALPKTAANNKHWAYGLGLGAITAAGLGLFAYRLMSSGKTAKPSELPHIRPRL